MMKEQGETKYKVKKKGFGLIKIVRLDYWNAVEIITQLELKDVKADFDHFMELG